MIWRARPSAFALRRSPAPTHSPRTTSSSRPTNGPCSTLSPRLSCDKVIHGSWRPALCRFSDHPTAMGFMERRANTDGRQHFEDLRDGLIRRLHCVCEHFAPEDLEALTLRMV